MPTTRNDTEKTSQKRLGRSQALLAVMLVAAVNIVLVVLNPLGKYDPERLPSAHSWIWWAAQDFVAQTTPPKVVILGSSLLMNPIQEQDANFQERVVDTVVEHRSAYLESQLRRDLGLGGGSGGVHDSIDTIGCFNFAVPGSLMSDNYMVLRALLNGERKPRAVVLGLALRDFIDNEVPCAAATPSFKYLSRYTDISDLVGLTMPNLWQRGEYWLNQHCYLIGKKLDIQSALSERATAIERPLVASRYLDCRLNAFDMSCYVPGFKSEVERNVWLTKPHQAHVAQDNTAEYRRRYRSRNTQLFECQKTFLDKFCRLAEQQQIKVIIVNMPVTPAHTALMPPGAYDQYVRCLTDASRQYRIPLLDLNSGGRFSQGDFWDTCHMQATGGKKLLDLLAAEMSKNADIAHAIGVSRGTSKVAAFGRTIY